MFVDECITDIEMKRNLDMATLRSFAAVAEQGGVTRAAASLHLTQSAVSMQIKRLEEQLNMKLFERHNRTLSLLPSGEQLLSYARRILELNDEAVSRLTDEAFEGELTLGVPHDIVYPSIPRVLRAVAAQFPRLKLNLMSSYTSALHEAFANGECDLILTTEQTLHQGGETLIELPLVFVGAPGGAAWRERPLRLAFENRCIFRPRVQAALDSAGIDWNMAVQSSSTRTVEATVSADLALHAMVAGTMRGDLHMVDHGGALPDLGMQKINLYTGPECSGPVAQGVISLLKNEYIKLGNPAAQAA